MITTVARARADMIPRVHLDAIVDECGGEGYALRRDLEPGVGACWDNSTKSLGRIYRAAMRRLLLVSCTCLACTRFNPAFDESLALDENGTETRGNTSEDTSEAEAEAETEASSEDPEDLPDELECPFEPSPGLALRFGDPEYFSGNCPNGVDAPVKILEAGGGQAVLAVCGEGCTNCGGEHYLSAYPMIITDYIPQNVDECLHLQASALQGQESSACVWGSISIHDPVTGTPYVIATTHASTPTPFGVDVLGEAIPEPLKADSCNCDAVGQGNDCCYQAEGPPEFWYYPLDGQQLFPGDFAPLAISNQANLQHYFKVYQAERLHSCESHDLELSWAVLAQL